MSCCVTLNICLSALYDDFYKTHTANTPGEKNVSHLAGVIFLKEARSQDFSASFLHRVVCFFNTQAKYTNKLFNLPYTVRKFN